LWRLRPARNLREELPRRLTVSEAKLNLPVPDADGVYRYPDGSGFRFIKRAGKWVGWWAPKPGSSHCCPLRGDNDVRSYFDSAEEVARAIAAGGEGPVAESDHPGEFTV